jgi:adenine deaminase
VLAQGGGIVALFEEGDQFTISLPLSGIMSLEPVEKLADVTTAFTKKLQF